MDVSNYFSKIGLKPINHRLQYERELKKVIGEKKFKEIDEEIRERQGEAFSDAQRIYRLKNHHCQALSLFHHILITSIFHMLWTGYEGISI